jgi:hypothetical protein
MKLEAAAFDNAAVMSSLTAKEKAQQENASDLTKRL